MTPTKKLINFYMPSDILQPFDRLCRLRGKSRSLALNELIADHILNAGNEAFSRMERVREIDKLLYFALENPPC